VPSRLEGRRKGPPTSVAGATSVRPETSPELAAAGAPTLTATDADPAPTAQPVPRPAGVASGESPATIDGTAIGDAGAIGTTMSAAPPGAGADHADGADVTAAPVYAISTTRGHGGGAAPSTVQTASPADGSTIETAPADMPATGPSEPDDGEKNSGGVARRGNPASVDADAAPTDGQVGGGGDPRTAPARVAGAPQPAPVAEPTQAQEHEAPLGPDGRLDRLPQRSPTSDEPRSARPLHETPAVRATPPVAPQPAPSTPVRGHQAQLDSGARTGRQETGSAPTPAHDTGAAHDTGNGPAHDTGSGDAAHDERGGRFTSQGGPGVRAALTSPPPAAASPTTAPSLDGAAAGTTATSGADAAAPAGARDVAGATSLVERAPAALHGDVASIAPWAERVVESVRVATLRGGGEMRLRLEPAGLGHIDVRITLAQDGVHATIAAEHDGTRALLRTEQYLLQAALERSDLRLAGFSVDLGFGASSGGFGDAERAAAGFAHQSAAPADVETATIPDVVDSATERGRLSVRV